MPDIGEGINEVVIAEWFINVGDKVNEFDPICEVESDKATATITSRFEGVITAIHYEVGVMAKVGKPLIDIMVAASSADIPNANSPPKLIDDEPTEKVQKPVENTIDVKNNSILQMLPSVRRLAKLEGVDLSLLQPTGRNGIILKEDVLRHLENKNKVNLTANNSKTISEPTKSITRDKNLQHEQQQQQAETIIPMSTIKKAMFKTMTKSLTIPHFNYSDEIDMTNLLETLRRRNENIMKKEQHLTGTKISNLAVIIKIISLSLEQYPELNGSLMGDEEHHNEQFIIKNYHNIGVAIDTKAGLVVPNIKNVQSLSIEQINSELGRLRELAYQSKLGPADLSGATITLSNIGAIGGIFGVPVIVKPEILIAALGKIRKLPRFAQDGSLEARDIVQIVWSADHRCVDGATLSRFSNLIKYYLENPESAMIKMK